MALSDAHNLLTQENWEGAELRDLVERALAPFGGVAHERLRLSGPVVRLTPRQAVALSMALHELGTNAAKYGALSVMAGRVDVRWNVSADGSAFELTWRERGGPQVLPPERRGFGTRLLGRGLAQDLDGTVDLEFEPDGVCCSIRAPLTHLEASGAGGPLDLHVFH